jgi:hypothetical protein
MTLFSHRRDKVSKHDEENSTADLLDHKRERRFLRKLDICLITWAWFAYLIKVSIQSRRRVLILQAHRCFQL